MSTAAPRWRRRKEARPGEIVAAALEVFTEKGFAAARLEDIAERAGVSKAALYLYFSRKEDIFHAVVVQSVAPQIEALRPIVDDPDRPFAETAPSLLAGVARIASNTPMGGVAKMVIGESRNFPEIARSWHDAVVTQGFGLLAELIRRGQQAGEVRPGDPRLHAFSLMGPVILGVIWREVFPPVGAEPIDLHQLAAQHTESMLHGLLVDPPA